MQENMNSMHVEGLRPLLIGGITIMTKTISVTISCTVDVPDDTTADDLRLWFWQDVENMMPVTSSLCRHPVWKADKNSIEQK